MVIAFQRRIRDERSRDSCGTNLARITWPETLRPPGKRPRAYLFCWSLTLATFGSKRVYSKSWERFNFYVCVTIHWHSLSLFHLRASYTRKNYATVEIHLACEAKTYFWSSLLSLRKLFSEGEKRRPEIRLRFAGSNPPGRSEDSGNVLPIFKEKKLFQTLNNVYFLWRKKLHQHTYFVNATVYGLDE